MPDAEKWHERFVQQARWTESVRRFLFQQANMPQVKAILEVGCGSGAILHDVRRYTGARLTGIDLRAEYLHLAKTKAPGVALARADALCLPFKEGSFSITCCHFLLLWVSDPLQVLIEMKRVTESGGFVLALAEPDYGGRIDYPVPLAELGRLQAKSLDRQGADPLMGRKLTGLFHRAGLKNVQTGVLGGQWSDPPSRDVWQSEWEALESDLSEDISPPALEELKRLDSATWQKGERILFVPTFFASGEV
jgi:SAM-dependent methyltransferase